MQKELCVVCQCRKCQHLLYLTIDSAIMNKIKNIEETNCPKCGEQGYLNWILRGVDNWNDRRY